MSITKKFIIILISSIFTIAIINVLSFYLFYKNNLKEYLNEKIILKKEISLDYINDIIEKQTLDEIDNIFSNTELNFFELIENWSWKINLEKQQNIDIVVSYLLKSWVSSKYIEEIIPQNNLKFIFEKLKDENSPEYKFLQKLTNSIIYTNIISILILIFIIFFFIRSTIKPITQATWKIKNLKPWQKDFFIEYEKKDEIWLLINAINWLNDKLNIQKTIRSKLLADISHELKTPITSIQCYLEWIRDWVIKLDKKNLVAITDEMNRLISLVNRIMTYEKFENQKLELDLKEYVIWDIVKELVETHKKRLKETKQRIKVTWDENLILSFDKNLFKQIVHNLIWNFQKYAWKWSLLTINISRTYIDFNDNWFGVSANKIPFLTEKFYQWNIEKTWDIKTRWIGVGLSLVQKIIDAHSWRIKIKTDQGKGFSFKIYYF